MHMLNTPADDNLCNFVNSVKGLSVQLKTSFAHDAQFFSPLPLWLAHLLCVCAFLQCIFHFFRHPFNLQLCNHDPNVVVSRFRTVVAVVIAVTLDDISKLIAKIIGMSLWQKDALPKSLIWNIILLLYADDDALNIWYFLQFVSLFSGVTLSGVGWFLDQTNVLLFGCANIFEMQIIYNSKLWSNFFCVEYYCFLFGLFRSCPKIKFDTNKPHPPPLLRISQTYGILRCVGKNAVKGAKKVHSKN